MKSNGVEHIISQFDFSSKDALSKLGVADHKLFEKMNDVFKKSKEPFLGVMLSTNNHGPWIIPPVTGKKFISTFDYTDWALEHFLDLASREDYFKNTIFVITGDHGKAMTPGYDFNLQATHIPCLIYNPNFIKPRVVKNICGHIDLTQTLLGMLQINYQTTNFGRDILHMPNEEKGLVLMQENNVLGFIYDDWYLIDRIEGNSSLYKYESETPLKDLSTEYPEVEKDLKEKARAIYWMGNELILNRKAAPKNSIAPDSSK
ncbi:MAG: sulfatase-like hydrolase/transferase [Calditrichota bacterium]